MRQTHLWEKNKILPALTLAACNIIQIPAVSSSTRRLRAHLPRPELGVWGRHRGVEVRPKDFDAR